MTRKGLIRGNPPPKKTKQNKQKTTNQINPAIKFTHSRQNEQICGFNSYIHQTYAFNLFSSLQVNT